MKVWTHQSARQSNNLKALRRFRGPSSITRLTLANESMERLLSMKYPAKKDYGRIIIGYVRKCFQFLRGENGNIKVFSLGTQLSFCLHILGVGISHAVLPKNNSNLQERHKKYEILSVCLWRSLCLSLSLSLWLLMQILILIVPAVGF